MKEQKPIQIFSNLNDDVGVNVIKSPVKLTILEMLRDSDMEFEEIVNNTGKSKSTVSVHLKSLRESGVISYRVHPVDNRKKIFYRIGVAATAGVYNIYDSQIVTRKVGKLFAGLYYPVALALIGNADHRFCSGCCFRFSHFKHLRKL